MGENKRALNRFNAFSSFQRTFIPDAFFSSQQKKDAGSFFLHGHVALKDRDSQLPKQFSDFNSYQGQQNGGYKLFR